MAISTRNSIFRMPSFSGRPSVSAPPPRAQHQHPQKPLAIPKASYDVVSSRNSISGGITRSRSFPSSSTTSTKAPPVDDAKLVELVKRIQQCVDTIQEIKVEVDSAAAKIQRRHTVPCP